jgi:Bacterial TSP3 repeat
MKFSQTVSVRTKFILKIVFLSFACIAFQAQAFKVDTHIWVAQQVINDLDDGFLSFKIGEKVLNIPVNPEVKTDILTNKEFYRMGSVGPDAFPGIFSGQSVIHPGSAGGGWGTGQWLEYLMKSSTGTPSSDKAFVYGIFSHAAGDVFAHTYVNSYAGGVFDLQNGEIDIEKRHFLLEAYISSRLPRVLDTSGSYLGTPADLVVREDALAVPDSFLMKAFVLNDEAAEQFKRGGATHLWAVNRERFSLEALIAEGGPVKELENLITKAIVYFFTNMLLTDEELAKADEIARDLQGLANDAVDEAQEIHDRITDLRDAVIVGHNDAVEDSLREAQNALAEFQRLTAEKNKLELEIATALDRLHSLIDPCNFLHCGFSCPSITVTYPCGTTGFPFYAPKFCNKKIEEPGCVSTRIACYAAAPHCSIHPERRSLENLISTKNDLEAAVLADISRNLGNFRSAVSRANDAIVDVLEAERQITQGLIDLGQRFNKDGPPLESLVRAWLDDIDITMKAYFSANARAIHNSLIGEPIEEPLEDWLKCHFPALLGLPSEILTAGCAVNDATDRILSAVDEIEAFLLQADPVIGNQVYQLKQQIKEDIEEAVQEQVYKFAENTLGIKVKELIDVLKLPPTEELLNRQYVIDDSLLSLNIFEDGLARRINRDMFLNNGVLDPAKYAVIANAVTLSKLALLDADGLNSLALSVGYSGAAIREDNIMYLFASNIDGNHQWLSLPPPYLRHEHFVESNLDTSDPLKSGYGYFGGPKFWTALELRNLLFRKLFIGPLVPGMEISSAEFSNKIPFGYPYKVTAECPFPSRIEDSGTDPCPRIDSDGDGLFDDEDSDDDNDGYTDSDEEANGTSTTDSAEKPPDNDGDLISDLNDSDDDNDGLSDAKEIELGTDPLKADSDGDGYDDRQEVETGTDPMNIRDTPVQEGLSVPFLKILMEAKKLRQQALMQ